MFIVSVIAISLIIVVLFIKLIPEIAIIYLFVVSSLYLRRLCIEQKISNVLGMVLFIGLAVASLFFMIKF